MKLTLSVVDFISLFSRQTKLTLSVGDFISLFPRQAEAVNLCKMSWSNMSYKLCGRLKLYLNEIILNLLYIHKVKARLHMSRKLSHKHQVHTLSIQTCEIASSTSADSHCMQKMDRDRICTQSHRQGPKWTDRTCHCKVSDKDHSLRFRTEIN